MKNKIPVQTGLGIRNLNIHITISVHIILLENIRIREYNLKGILFLE